MAEHRKRLAGNFISLSLVQGLSILFPLITFPYLLRILGVENFGIFTLIQTFLMYFDLLVSFGFGLTATQLVSKHANDPDETNDVIVSVYIIKLILFFLSLLAFLVCCLFIPYLRENFLLVLISTLYLLGNLLFPDWYFQGIQKMRNITIVAFVSKVISLALIVILVKQRSDISYAVFALSSGNFIAGLIGFFILFRFVSIKRRLPKKTFAISLFKESSYVFASAILAPLYSSVNLFILQVFTNPLMVGYYAIAEKIFNAIGMLTSIANRTFYPHLAQLYTQSITAYKKNIRHIVRLFMLSFIVMAIGLFISSDFVVHLLAGKNNQDVSYAVEILRIMSFGLIFSPYGSFFFQLQILQGQKTTAIRNIIITIIINLVTGSLCAHFFSGKGMAVNYCMIVFTIGFLNYMAFNKKLKTLSDN